MNGKGLRAQLHYLCTLTALPAAPVSGTMMLMMTGACNGAPRIIGILTCNWLVGKRQHKQYVWQYWYDVYSIRSSTAWQHAWRMRVPRKTGCPTLVECPISPASQAWHGLCAEHATQIAYEHAYSERRHGKNTGMCSTCSRVLLAMAGLTIDHVAICLS